MYLSLPIFIFIFLAGEGGVNIREGYIVAANFYSRVGCDKCNVTHC